MERQQDLFPGSGLGEQAIYDLVSPLHPQLFRMINEPFVDLLEYRRTDPNFRLMDEGETAQWLRPQIADRATRFLGGVEGIRIKKHNNQFQIVYEGKVIIVPKKLKLRGRNRTRLTFSSFLTRQNREYWEQRSVSGVDDLPRLLVGYLPQKEMTEIKIMIVYPKGKFARFCYLMPSPAETGLAVHEQHEDVTEDEAAGRGFVVKPKKDVRKTN